MAPLGRARRAAVFGALSLAAFAACGRGAPIPRVPEEFNRLEQREAGCLECHDGRRAPTLDPNVTMTPTAHPPTAVAKALEQMNDTERQALRMPE